MAKAKKFTKAKKRYKEIVVFGCGRFGEQVILSLANLPQFKIIAVDLDQNRLKLLPKNVTSVVVGDSSKEKFIDELGVEHADLFVIAIGTDIQASLLTAVILRKKFSNARIIAKAVNNDQEAILRQLGITEIINPEKAGAKRAVVKILNPLLGDAVKHRDSIGSIQELEGNMSLVRIKLPFKYIGKKVKDTKIPKTINIVLAYRNEIPMVVYGDFKFEDGDEILILADNNNVMNYILSNTEN